MVREKPFAWQNSRATATGSSSRVTSMRSKRPPPKSISTAAMASLRYWRGREGVRVVGVTCREGGGRRRAIRFLFASRRFGADCGGPARAGAFVRGDARARFRGGSEGSGAHLFFLKTDISAARR